MDTCLNLLDAGVPIDVSGARSHAWRQLGLPVCPDTTPITDHEQEHNVRFRLSSCFGRP